MVPEDDLLLTPIKELKHEIPARMGAINSAFFPRIFDTNFACTVGEHAIFGCVRTVTKARFVNT